MLKLERKSFRNSDVGASRADARFARARFGTGAHKVRPYVIHVGASLADARFAPA